MMIQADTGPCARRLRLARYKMKTKIVRYIIPERIPWFAAGLYSELARGAGGKYYRQVAEEIAAAANQGSILDVGTGPGYLPIEIARIAPHVKIDGIDLTKRMIIFARVNAEEAGVSDRIRFTVGNGNRTAFQDNSFDMVISTGAFHSWRNPVKVMNECRRVLKPGKEAWIYDPAQIVTRETRKPLQEKLKGLDRLALKWAVVTSKAVKDFTREEIREMIHSTKFREGRVEYTDWMKITLKK